VSLETATQPKCNFVDARTTERYRRLGLSMEIRAAAPLAKVHPRVAFATLFCGYEFGSFDLLQMRREAAAGQGELGPEPSLNISQLFLEPLLRRRTESAANVGVRFGSRLVSFESSDEHAIATIEDVRTGTSVTNRVLEFMNLG